VFTTKNAKEDHVAVKKPPWGALWGPETLTKIGKARATEDKKKVGKK